MTTYKVFKFDILASEDRYEDGCVLYDQWKTSEISFESCELDELLKQIAKYFGINISDFSKREDENELKFSIFEDKEGLIATNNHIELWKNNQCRLWYCTYIFEVYAIDSLDIDLDFIQAQNEEE